jgi:hypothetical protein
VAKPGRPKKEQFADLDEEFKALIDGGNEGEIRLAVQRVALNESDNQEAKKADEDLREKKEQAKMAGEGYADATKANKVRVEYAKFMLQNMGKHAAVVEAREEE